MDKKFGDNNERILKQLLHEEGNNFCADCQQKGTRWASWNIGVFLCIKCGGMHRRLGTHISKIKSVTLDKWTDEQVQHIRERGNIKMNKLYNPKNRPAPSNSNEMEKFIKDKYERKLFMDPADRDKLERELQKLQNPTEATPISKYSWTAREPSDSYSMSSNYLPSTISEYDQDRFSHSLKELYDMGFRAPSSNLIALKASQGDIAQAIEYLIASGQENPSSLSNSPSLDNRSSEKDVNSNIQKMKDMGFKDESLIREALNQTENLESAINYVVLRTHNSPSPAAINLFDVKETEEVEIKDYENKNILSTEKTKSPSPDAISNKWKTSFPPPISSIDRNVPREKTNENSTGKTPSSNMEDLFSSTLSLEEATPSLPPIEEPAKSKTVPKMGKESILSLYSAPVKAPTASSYPILANRFGSFGEYSASTGSTADKMAQYSEPVSHSFQSGMPMNEWDQFRSNHSVGKESVPATSKSTIPRLSTSSIEPQRSEPEIDHDPFANISNFLGQSSRSSKMHKNDLSYFNTNHNNHIPHSLDRNSDIPQSEKTSSIIQREGPIENINRTASNEHVRLVKTSPKSLKDDLSMFDPL